MNRRIWGSLSLSKVRPPFAIRFAVPALIGLLGCWTPLLAFAQNGPLRPGIVVHHSNPYVLRHRVLDGPGMPAITPVEEDVILPDLEAFVGFFDALFETASLCSYANNRVRHSFVAWTTPSEPATISQLSAALAGEATEAGRVVYNPIATRTARCAREEGDEITYFEQTFSIRLDVSWPPPEG